MSSGRKPGDEGEDVRQRRGGMHTRFKGGFVSRGCLAHLSENVVVDSDRGFPRRQCHPEGGIRTQQGLWSSISSAGPCGVPSVRGANPRPIR